MRMLPCPMIPCRPTGKDECLQDYIGTGGSNPPDEPEGSSIVLQPLVVRPSMPATDAGRTTGRRSPDGAAERRGGSKPPFIENEVAEIVSQILAVARIEMNG